jgi:hypothetical protein
MRERLAELNRGTQSNLLKEEVHGEVVVVSDSKSGEVVATPPISSAQQLKKAG